MKLAILAHLESRSSWYRVPAPSFAAAPSSAISSRDCASARSVSAHQRHTTRLQRYLAHKKQQPHRTLQ